MSRKCEICGKGQTSGNNVSHSVRRTRRKWNANIQSVRIADDQIQQSKPCPLIKGNKRELSLRQLFFVYDGHAAHLQRCDSAFHQNTAADDQNDTKED